MNRKNLIVSTLLIFIPIMFFGQVFKVKNTENTKLEILGNQNGLKKILFPRAVELPDSALYFWWDSLSWDTSNMEIYKYDQNGHITELISKYYFDGSFVNNQKTINSYNVQDQLILTVRYFWDSINWVASDREKHNFINGLPSSNFYEYYDSTTWVLIYGDSNSYTFNTDNLPTSVINRYYDEFEGKWVPQQKVDITYDANKKPATVTMFEWTGTNWRNNSRMINLRWDLGFNFNNSEPTAYVNQYFQGGKWVNLERYHAIVNNSLIVRDSAFYWENATKKWMDSVSTTYTYNSSNKLLEKFQRKWDGSVWDTSEVEVHEYDGKGNETYSMNGSKYWGTWFQIWSAQKTNYTYGPNDQIRAVAYESYDPFTGEWYKNFKVKYYYKSMAAIKNQESSAWNIYPNPVTESLIVACPVGKYYYYVSNTNGEVLKIGELLNTGTCIDLKALKAGIYILKIMDEKGETRYFKVRKL